MLDPEVASKITEHLRLLRYRVELVLAADGERADEVVELVGQLASLSPMVTVVRGTHARHPSFAVTRPGSEVALHFAGAPTGDTLSALVLAVLQVGGHPPRVGPADVARARALDIPMELETWFATSCRSCGDTLHAFGAISVLNPALQHTAVNGGFFRDEAAARGITSVPVVFVNGERLTQGRLDVGQALDALERLTG